MSYERIVWWCETFQDTMIVRHHEVTDDGRYKTVQGAPPGNPFPCCQTKVPFSDVPVEDRGCGLRRVEAERLEPVPA